MTSEPSSHQWPERSPRFSTTRWTIVLQAGSNGPEREAAMEQLCRTYWYPVYAFIRRRGMAPEDARDLTQAFFAKMLRREWITGVEQREARFSTWLVTLVKTHLMKEHAREAAMKRGGERPPVSFDHALAEDWFGAEPATDETPERIFERRWALAVLDAALQRLREDCEATGKTKLFETLSPFLSRKPEAAEYAAIAAALQIRENSVAVSVHRLRHQYRDMLRQELAAGLKDPAMIDEELRHLAASL